MRRNDCYALFFACQLHIVTICMAPIFLWSDVIFVHLIYWWSINPMTACPAFIHITLLGPHSIIFHLIKFLLQKKPDSESWELRKLHFLFYTHCYTDFTRIKNLPHCIYIQHFLQWNCRNKQNTVKNQFWFFSFPLCIVRSSQTSVIPGCNPFSF